MKNPYLSLRQAANYLACDPKTLRKWVKEGKIPYLDLSKPGASKKSYGFDVEDLDRAREVL